MFFVEQQRMRLERGFSHAASQLLYIWSGVVLLSCCIIVFLVLAHVVVHMSMVVTCRGMRMVRVLLSCGSTFVRFGHGGREQGAIGPISSIWSEGSVSVNLLATGRR